MAQSIKCLPGKHEALSLSSKNPHQSCALQPTFVIAERGRQRQVDLTCPHTFYLLCMYIFMCASDGARVCWEGCMCMCKHACGGQDIRYWSSGHNILFPFLSKILYMSSATVLESFLLIWVMLSNISYYLLIITILCLITPIVFL